MWGSFTHREKNSVSEILLPNLEVLCLLRAGLGYFCRGRETGTSPTLATFAILMEGARWNYRLLGKSKFQK